MIEYIHKRAAYIFPDDAVIYLNGSKLSVEIGGKKIANLSKYLSGGQITNDKGQMTNNDGNQRTTHSAQRLRNDDRENARQQLSTPTSASHFSLLTSHFKIGLPITGSGAQLAREYQAVADYFESHSEFDFLHFDYVTSHELALCTFFKSADMVRADNIIQDIYKELPYLLNIFKRPLIHLREADVVMPVDAVKRVNHDTVRYLARHTEDAESIKGSTVKPAHLLTRIYEDDFSIYENVVFRDLVDKFLIFLKRRIYYLTEILDMFRELIRIDAITRLNHPKYYLAIGKLYVGFSKLDNSSEIVEMLDSTNYLYKQFSQNRTRDVYAKNAKVKPISGEIKRTNILTMHKDYKHVYSLHQKFNKKILEAQAGGTAEEQYKSRRSYGRFCELITLFSASNFNLSCNPRDAIYQNGRTGASFSNENWKVSVAGEYNAALDFDVISVAVTHNEGSFKFLIIPMSYYIAYDKKQLYEHIVGRLYASGAVYDKYVFFEPFLFDNNSMNNYSVKMTVRNTDLFYAVLPISVSEINSFRRIQKLLFEGMVRSRRNHTSCAFCGSNEIVPASAQRTTRNAQFMVGANTSGKMKNETGKAGGAPQLLNSICEKCRTAITTIRCNACRKRFTATYIAAKSKRAKKETDEVFLKDLSDFYRQEKQYAFRNIVNMSGGDFVCPHCGGLNRV